ncbi:RHS repeat-associated core domain-containing protein [Victivallis lenta]|uniref:RHS repeat-associated core domain-containing protein n=1 Tax=Victivallis lenta TaxID=2606640 RepID=UPI003AB3CFF2
MRNGTGSGDQVTATVYDAQNRPVTATDPEGNSVETVYDLAGNKVRTVDPAGNATDYEYDAANRLVKTVLPSVFDGETGTTRRPETVSVYDKRGSVVSATDVRGVVTATQYDVLARPVRTAVQLENGAEFVTETGYDVLGNVTMAKVWRDAETALTTVTEYDSFNRPVKITDAAGKVERISYDTIGNKLTATDKRGYVANFEYDRANRLVRTMLPVLPGGIRPTSTTGYDKAGRMISQTDPNGKISRTEYDAAGRVLKTTDAAGGTVVNTYDQAGNILTRTVANDPSAQVTAYTYDRRNLQLTETLNPGETGFERVTQSVYDSRGLRTRRIQPSGAVTDYVFDAQGRLLSSTQQGAPDETRLYTYNAAGSIVRVEENTRATGYTLDRLGRTVSERTYERASGSGWQEKSEITSVYDPVGNRLAVHYPNGRSLTSTYDLRNLLLTVTDGTRVTGYGYDDAGNRTSMLMPNGVGATYTFDSNNRLTKIEHKNLLNANLYTVSYTLDPAGMRTTAVETGENRSSRLLTFVYDDRYQLTQESDSMRPGNPTVSYTYDKLGNRLSRTDGGVATTCTVDKLNRVTQSTTGSGVTAYTYDLNGNLASKTAGGTTRSYRFDRENRLVGVDEGGSEIFSAVYDYRCRRLAKTENGATVSYLYDGGVSVQEFDAEGSLTNVLVRAGGYGGGIGDVVYTENPDGTGREYFLYNATGTTSALSDDDGSVTSTSRYDAFGNETGTTGGTDNVRRFSTKERSVLLSLDYFGFRYYDPELGRFITRDPSGYPDGPNNYLYCSNNPVNRIDPLGLFSDEIPEEERQRMLENQRRNREEVEKMKTQPKGFFFRAWSTSLF